MARRKNKFTVRDLLDWRRVQVAELSFKGWDVNRIADRLKLDPRTIYYDLKYIEDHADEIMHNYLVKTVPHILNKSLYRLDLANREAWQIVENSKVDRDKISALQVVGKTARDIVELIANNQSIVDHALALDNSLSDQQNEEEEKEEEDDNDNGVLLTDSTEEQAEEPDDQAKF